MLERGPKLDHITGYKTAGLQSLGFSTSRRSNIKTKTEQSGNIEGLGYVWNGGTGSGYGSLGK